MGIQKFPSPINIGQGLPHIAHFIEETVVSHQSEKVPLHNNIVLLMMYAEMHTHTKRPSSNGHLHAYISYAAIELLVGEVPAG